MLNNVMLCQKFSPLLDPGVSEVVEPSGRSSGKSTANEVAAVTLMLQSPENNIWYCRAELGDIRSTVFTSLWSTIQMMGVDKFFKQSLSPMQIRCLTTGAVCYFSGINGKTDDDLTATKGFTPQRKSLAMCILDEADQVKHYNHITAWKSTADRFLLPYGKIVYAYNPPMGKSHWAHRFFGDKIKAGAARIYTTWEDIRGQLKRRAIEEILRFRENDPEYYRYWYLGEPVSFKGMVYPQFKRERHVINIFDYLRTHPRDHPVQLILGLDEGTVNDSTCVTPLVVMASGIAIAVDCLEIDPLVDGQKSPAETSRILYKYLGGLIKEKFPFLLQVPRHWIFESAEGGQMLKLQFQQDTGEIVYLVKNKSIMGDVKRVRSMLSEGILFFHSAPNVTTKILIEDIENYVFDEKTKDIKKGQRDDTIDSLEYATKQYYNAPINTAR